jgi:mycothiol synthase
MSEQLLSEPAERIDWQIRPYKEGDVPAIVALINAADAVDEFDQATGEAAFRVGLDHPRSEPERDLIVVEGPRMDGVPAGMPLAYGWLDSDDDEANNERNYRPRYMVHPSARGMGLEQLVVARLVDMAREREAEPDLPRMAKVNFTTGVRERDAAKRALWEEIGLREVRRFWQMYRPLDEPLDEPAHIEGVTIRPYRLPEDNQGAMEAYNSSFSDHFDFQPDSLEDWEHGISSEPCRTDLSWLAEIDAEPGKMAGFCICWVYDEKNRLMGRNEGWIDILGTIRGWRGKGLGRSLLLHGLHSLKEAGLDTALLGVDSTSPTGANHLYESVGFRVRHVSIIYQAALGEIRNQKSEIRT